MPRVMTRFGCAWSDGVHAKFLTEEKQGRRVLVSMPMRDQSALNKAQAMFSEPGPVLEKKT